MTRTHRFGVACQLVSLLILLQFGSAFATEPLAGPAGKEAALSKPVQVDILLGLAMVALKDKGPVRKYLDGAALSREQEKIVLELAAKRGIEDVREISTYQLYPTAARGIAVQGADQVRGREVSNRIVHIRFKDWWHPGQAPGEGDIRIGDFWAEKPFTRKQTILRVSGKEYRVDSVQGLSLEEAETLLGWMMKGTYSIATGVQKDQLEQIAWDRPQFLRKGGDTVTVVFLHREEGGGFFELELRQGREGLTVQQVLQAVP